MSNENSGVEEMYKSVRKFQDLGTGRNCRKILVGDSDDARTSNFKFVGHVHQNWPSWKQLTFRVGAAIKTFDTATQTLNGNPAYIFLWNDLTEALWLRQVEREKLLAWISAAEPHDQIGMAELIVEETESKYRVCTYPGLAQMAVSRIRIEILKLSLQELRRLNSLTVTEARSAVAQPTSGAKGLVANAHQPCESHVPQARIEQAGEPCYATKQ